MSGQVDTRSTLKSEISEFKTLKARAAGNLQVKGDLNLHRQFAGLVRVDSKVKGRLVPLLAFETKIEIQSFLLGHLEKDIFASAILESALGILGDVVLKRNLQSRIEAESGVFADLNVVRGILGGPDARLDIKSDLVIKRFPVLGGEVAARSQIIGGLIDEIVSKVRLDGLFELEKSLDGIYEVEISLDGEKVGVIWLKGEVKSDGC